MKILPVNYLPGNVQRALVTIALMLVSTYARSFTLIELLHDPSCGQTVVFIPDSLYYNLSGLSVNVYIDAVDRSGDDSSLYSGTVSLSDSTYFQYLGDVVLDSTDTADSRLHAYRFVYSGYTPIEGGSLFGWLTLIDVNVSYEDYGQDFFGIQKSCSPCIGCPSRYLMLFEYNNLGSELFGTSCIPFSGYGGCYDSLPSYSQQTIATVLNWIIDDSTPTVSDYINILNPAQKGNSTTPSSFCNTSNITNTCSCQQNMLDIMNDIINTLSTIYPGDDTDFESYQEYVTETAPFLCLCSSTYEFSMYSTSDVSGYVVFAIPTQAGLPTLEARIVFDGGNIYSTVAYSYNYQRAWGITYAGSGNFNYINGFIPADTDPSDIPFSNVRILPGGIIASFCNGDSVILSLNPTYPNVYWSNGDTTQTITVKTAGGYDVTVIDSEGCYAYNDTAKIVIVFNNPVGHAGNDTTICYGMTVTLGSDTVATGGDSTATYTYLWVPSRGLNDSSLANPTASPSVTTTYILTVTDSNGCTGRDTVIVTVHSYPIPNISPSDTFVLSGQNVTLHATGGSFYSWSGLGETAASIVITAISDSAYYIVVVSDSFGCSASDTALVRTLPFPIIIDTNYRGTINSGDSTYISVHATDNGTAITWTRDNDDSISGPEIGHDSIIKIPLTNYTGHVQKTNFTFSGSKDGYHTNSLLTSVYVAPGSPITAMNLRLPEVITACMDTDYKLTVTSKDTAPFIITIDLSYSPLNFQFDSVPSGFTYTEIGSTVYFYSSHNDTGTLNFKYSFTSKHPVNPVKQSRCLGKRLVQVSSQAKVLLFC